MLWMRRNRRQYLKVKEEARQLVHERVRHFNQAYGFPVGRIFIKNHRSRWGSCSQKGNLNFNYKIVFLPAELADYIVVHELCHLREFNHSPRFWRLVEEVIPDHRKRRLALRHLERSSVARILSR
jgi:predicted metal-dependent hydrolase